MSAPDIIVGDFYPHIRDAILSHLFNCDLYSLRATCTALRDAVDPLTLDTLVITGHPYHPKMQVCCLHGRSPALSPFFDPYFKNASDATLQRYRMLFSRVREVEIRSNLYHHFRHWYFVDDDPDPFAPGTTLGVVLGTIPHNIRRVQYTLVNVESLKLFRAGEGVPAEDIVPAFKHAINSEIRLVHPSMSEKEVDEMMDKIEFMTKEDYIAREGSDQL
ncbi:uncharacterized protein EHS24_003655 [Apiotrichum porosum]|uniref:Uncharacterized protein n=1 Tax=Apiotrichum porosum TaxID=105984 RepID=A0A427XE80_9TREE|nr:uncharacterized protein EHS24_003655 [Apiotrichum porosum]RSH77037.1 hypothetical protein EHS24_003655 [Apiotrichum porosum]